MSDNEKLISMCQHMLKETKLIENWEKLIAVGEVSPGRAGMFVYSYDVFGNYLSSAPKGFETLRALKDLHQTMTENNPTGRSWVGCLLRVGSNGKFSIDFEYSDISRWTINPKNMEQRIAEFAAMPV